MQLFNLQWLAVNHDRRPYSLHQHEQLTTAVTVTTHITVYFMITCVALVSSPDPTPKRRKGSGTHRALSGTSLVPSPLSRTRREGVWPNVYRARVARATYSARQSDARIKSHDCAGTTGMHINDCARARLYGM